MHHAIQHTYSNCDHSLPRCCVFQYNLAKLPTHCNLIKIQNKTTRQKKEKNNCIWLTFIQSESNYKFNMLLFGIINAIHNTYICVWLIILFPFHCWAHFPSIKVYILLKKDTIQSANITWCVIGCSIQWIRRSGWNNRTPPDYKTNVARMQEL